MSARAESPAPATALSDQAWLRLADLALASRVVLEADVRRTQRISGSAAADVPPTHSRHLIGVDLTAALKAPSVLPARGEWLWQGAGRAAPVRRADPVLAFLADPSAGQAPEVMHYRLVAPDAMIALSPENAAATRDILVQAKGDQGRYGLVRAVTDGFHTPGAVEGQSESQFFLDTQGGRPLTLIVSRAPSAEPVVHVATGNVISATAGAVQPRTLLWRSLACGLPDALPPSLAADRALAADYAVARAAFPRC